VPLLDLAADSSSCCTLAPSGAPSRPSVVRLWLLRPSSRPICSKPRHRPSSSTSASSRSPSTHRPEPPPPSPAASSSSPPRHQPATGAAAAGSGCASPGSSPAAPRSLPRPPLQVPRRVPCPASASPEPCAAALPACLHLHRRHQSPSPERSRRGAPRAPRPHPASSAARRPSASTANSPPCDLIFITASCVPTDSDREPRCSLVHGIRLPARALLLLCRPPPFVDDQDLRHVCSTASFVDDEYLYR